MEVESYQRYIFDTVFPDAISALQLCKNAEEVSSWKRTLSKQIGDKKVEDEETSS